MFNVITEPGTSQPGFKLGGYCDQEGDATLARLRCTRESLFAAAATVAAKARPDAFGELTRVGELAEKATKLKAELDRLFAEIEVSWTRADVTMLSCVQHHRDDSACRLSVNFTGGAIFIGERLGERLANWRLSQNIAKAA